MGNKSPKQAYPLPLALQFIRNTPHALKITVEDWPLTAYIDEPNRAPKTPKPPCHRNNIAAADTTDN